MTAVAVNTRPSVATTRTRPAPSSSVHLWGTVSGNDANKASVPLHHNFSRGPIELNSQVLAQVLHDLSSGQVGEHDNSIRHATHGMHGKRKSSPLRPHRPRHIGGGTRYLTRAWTPVLCPLGRTAQR